MQAVIVVGGGAAGLMAAGQAASAGAAVTLLEKKRRPGRKLRITGKGRCNLTNIAPLRDFIAHFGSNGRFLHQAFARFFSEDLIAFFDEIGLPTKTERGGRVFPASDRAGDVVDVLVAWVNGQGVRTRNDTAVARLEIAERRIVAVGTDDGATVAATAVVVATGGLSYAATGSSGDGYRLATAAGHSVVPLRPALVPLQTAGDVAAKLSGLRLRNVRATLRVADKVALEQFGELLFADYGIAGPVTLTLARAAVDALAARHTVTVTIDFKPALDERQLDARLLREIKVSGRRRLGVLLAELLPAQLIAVCCELNEVSPDKPAGQITAPERARLRRWLKGFSLEIVGHRGFDEAIVTAGGVSLAEIDPRTMQSRIVRGLFFAGEVLDVDGDTGGYNLQAAFSSGWLAGRSAADGALAADAY